MSVSHDTTCSTCTENDKSYALGNLKIDLKRIEARIGGIRLRLTPQEFRLLHCLMVHNNEIVEFDDLFAWTFDDPDNDRKVNSLRALVSRIRTKILGHVGRVEAVTPNIESRYGFGYGIMVDGDLSMAAVA